MKVYGISGKMFDLIIFSLSNHKTNVVLNGHFSSSFSIKAGVPQGPILGATLFLIFIYYVLDIVNSLLVIYSDQRITPHLMVNLIGWIKTD